MSCSHCHTESCECDPTLEPLSSALDNFTTAFFGTLSKTCVNGKIVWTLPCNLDAGAEDFPRNSGEGLACYFVRFAEAFFSSQVTTSGNKGYRLTTLTNSDVALFRSVDVINQDFDGTLTGPVNIAISSNGATEGDEFFISFDGLVITATNNIEITSDAVSLLVIDTPGTLDGYIKAVYTGTAWKLTLITVNIT